MKCEDLYNEILNTYDSEYIQKSMLTQCSSASDGNFFVINDNKKKIYFSLFFEATYKNDEKVYADFKTVDNILMWQLKASEDKVDKEKITKIIMLILKGQVGLVLKTKSHLPMMEISRGVCMMELYMEPFPWPVETKLFF